jgi:hypothetical protein
MDQITPGVGDRALQAAHSAPLRRSPNNPVALPRVICCNWAVPTVNGVYGPSARRSSQPPPAKGHDRPSATASTVRESLRPCAHRCVR